jgi:hypothetical protein
MRWRYSIHQEDQRIIFLFFVLWVTSLLISGLFFIFGPPFIPLWYTVPLAAEQLADRMFIWVFPALSFVILILSLWQGRRTNMEHERYLARLSLISGLILMVFLLVAELRILKIIL